MLAVCTFCSHATVPRLCYPPSSQPRNATVCSLQPKRKRKPNDYWKDIQNVRRELEALNPQSNHQAPRKLPSAAFLRQIGRRDLDNAITNMGGYDKVANMLEYSRASSKQCAGFWNDFDNLKAHLLKFVEERNSHGPNDLMPTLQQLRDAKRSDIATAIATHGGVSTVAAKLGLRPVSSKKKKHYWTDWNVVESEIRNFVAQRAKRERNTAREKSLNFNRRRALRMPSQRELRAAGRTDLAEAITNYHGGFRLVAKRMGFISRKKDDFFYDQFYNLARELYAFVHQVGSENVMPTTAVLRADGRTDLSAAIVKYGGMSVVSQRLGLHYRVRAREAFKEWSVFQRQLLSFMKMHGKPGEIPSSRTLTNFGRDDLYQAILHHGGSRAVADHMGLQRNYWQDFSHVGSQVLQFIATHGTEGIMPTESEFVEVGRRSLNVAVAKFGYSQVAKRLGLKEATQSTSLAFDTLLKHSAFSDEPYP